MVFTRKRASFKRSKRPMRRSFKGRKRTYTRARLVTKRRSYKRARVVSRKRHSMPIHSSRAPKYLFPKGADRLRVVLPHKLHMALTWANTAEGFLGTVIDCTALAVQTLSAGPFQNVWPTSGSNVTCNKVVAGIPNFLTECTQFQMYYVSGVDVKITVTRQNALDGTTIKVGTMPLNRFQRANLILRNTGASPLTNLNYVPPGYLITDVSTSSNIPAECIHALEQQANVRMRSLSNPMSGKPIAVLRQRYSAKKVQDIGFPYDAQFQGTLPQTVGSNGTPPTAAHYQYFFMMDDGGGTASANQNYDIDFDISLHVTMFRRTWNSLNSLTAVPPDFHDPGNKEEKKTEKKDPEGFIGEDDGVDDLVDPPLSLQGLSLTTPKGTCLNSSHPSVPHDRVSTCV